MKYLLMKMYNIYLIYSSGFFAEYGRPETTVKDHKVIIFWPDEWKTVLGIYNSQL